MSTTPQQQHAARAAPRRSGRKNNKNHHHDPATVTAAFHPSGVVSENDLSAAQADIMDDNKHSGRRPRGPPGSSKKQHIPSGNASDFAADRTRTTPTKATPMKSHAYAGATFTNSPAASALPMPSFYSRSVPNVVGQILARPDTASHEEERDKYRSSNALHDGSPSKQEVTPLDFLFQAARQAKALPRGHSPSTNSAQLSIGANTPPSHSPAPREPEAVFPFELDGGASTPGEESDSFTTPSYKDRIAALRSTSQSVPSKTREQLSELERLEKAAALKKLLIKESQPSSSQSADMSNPFNARPAQPRAYSNPSNLPPPRPTSLPSTPCGSGTYPFQPNGLAAFPPAPIQFPQYAANSNHRQASGLRNNIALANESEPANLSLGSADAAGAAAVTSPMMPTGRIPVNHGIAVRPDQPQMPLAQAPAHKAKPSIAQMEEQMRSFLKLDVASKG